MYAATIVALALLGLSFIVIAVSSMLHARAVRRATPLAHHYLLSHKEATVMDVTAWITEREGGFRVHHAVVAEALRELERTRLATSRLQRTGLPPARAGYPMRVYQIDTETKALVADSTG